MQLDELKKHWNAFAKTDPFWAILTVPDKANGRWTREEFFATGKIEIDALMQSLAALDWNGRRGRALDFGCGVGRLTQVLCDYFEEVCGVDIAADMLSLADKFNRHGLRCTYRLNTAGDLSLFADDSFDFVYSNIVLQHMKPEFALMYIREFLRVLAPAGLIVFQLPAELIPHVTRPATPAVLPPGAFRAVIVPGAVEQTMRASAETTITAVVRNVSDCTWPQSSVWLGNHWLTGRREVLLLDDGRTVLSQELPPGAEARLSLRITAPQRPGVYLLELDMVLEGVAWFKNRGSKTAVLAVRVEDAQTRPADTAAVFKPQMEMYGTPLEAVVTTVTQAHGRFVEIRQDRYAGPNWRSYRYCITKD